jgi:hypothetical protein
MCYRLDVVSITRSPFQHIKRVTKLVSASLGVLPYMYPRHRWPSEPAFADHVLIPNTVPGPDGGLIAPKVVFFAVILDISRLFSGL